MVFIYQSGGDNMECVIKTMYNDANNIVIKIGEWKESFSGYKYATFKHKRTGALLLLSTCELKRLEDIQEGDYSNL